MPVHQPQKDTISAHFKTLLSLFFLFLVAGCASTQLSRLEETMDPMVGVAKRGDVEKSLGNPTQCVTEKGMLRCEYRTLIARNEPVPSAHKKEPGFGPDLSPYEFFDVIEAFYDDTGLLRDWRPLSVKP